ncbi:major facilitator superfamily transporter [Stachybotrys elegans]|uniref:Major facilitator superfamily transporter n=1 Tax=Stachybotrys elegans TaxID=80388 RepID=A0A8K0SNV5_9HYPO|nr:major facilitator superfamily transporter [Stachybotrys elegans]
MSDTSGSEAELTDYVEGWALFFLLVGICLAVFLISLDRTIITTAIPYITREFQSTRDIGWYGSSYLLTACAFQPVFGRIFLLFSSKWSYLVAVVTFEIGSLICGVSPNSLTLIIGRAIAGFGSAGILTGSFTIAATSIPPRTRPIHMAIVGMMFGVGASVGPLFGGVFTDLVTWRWCFYINLPVGGITILAFIFCYRSNRPKNEHRSWMSRFLELDLVGNAILLIAAVMLFLALEFTVEGQPWGEARVVGLLCGSGISAVLFIIWQWWKQDGALLPPAIVCQRSVAASCVMGFMIYGSLLSMTFFLPLWFQGVGGDSALTSGVNMIPYFIVNAFGALVAGVFVSIVGYYVPPCIVGNAIAMVGAGLLTTLTTKTTTAEWAIYEIIVAAGLGLSIQQGFTAVQTVLPEDEVSIGTAAVVASQSFGGAVFVSVGNNIFQNEMVRLAKTHNITGVDVREVVGAGATAFRDLVRPEILPEFIHIYNEALQQVFYSVIPLVGLALVSSFFFEWRSIKVKKPNGEREKTPA